VEGYLYSTSSLKKRQKNHYEMNRDYASVTSAFKATLHLEARLIRCVRGLESSLVIGQKVEIGPNSFTPRGRADLVV
jgi:hypothetical protein